MTDYYRSSLKKAKFRNTGIMGTWKIIGFINTASDNYEVMYSQSLI